MALRSYQVSRKACSVVCRGLPTSGSSSPIARWRRASTRSVSPSLLRNTRSPRESRREFRLSWAGRPGSRPLRSTSICLRSMNTVCESIPKNRRWIFSSRWVSALKLRFLTTVIPRGGSGNRDGGKPRFKVYQMKNSNGLMKNATNKRLIFVAGKQATVFAICSTLPYSEVSKRGENSRNKTLPSRP